MKLVRWCSPLALAVAFAACGGSKPAQEPENSETSSDDAGAGAGAGPGGGSADQPASTDSTPTSSTPVAGDDAKKKPTPCGGFDIPDLLSVISQAACEVDGAKPDSQQKDMKGVLEVHVVPDSPRIAPGSSASVTVTFKNKGKTDLPLDFIVDPEPRFDFEVYTLKGSRADAPKGDAPALPPEVANASAPEPKIARVTLAQQGTAKLTLKYEAVKYKWAPKERAKGALPGHGYPKEAAGPLPKGTYILRVIMPLTNVFEGVDHDVSQPRAQITVAKMP
jgi:hypothetical protein